MSVPPFQKRLATILVQGNLTVADLARWVGKPHPTVRGWTRGGNLGLPPLDAAYVTARLELLERMLRRKKGLPVPRMSARDRIAYLNTLRVNP